MDSWEYEEVKAGIDKTTTMVHEMIDESNDTYLHKQGRKSNWDFAKDQYLEAYAKMLEIIKDLQEI